MGERAVRVYEYEYAVCDSVLKNKVLLKLDKQRAKKEKKEWDQDYQ
jgi:hypothetical protein